MAHVTIGYIEPSSHYLGNWGSRAEGCSSSVEWLLSEMERKPPMATTCRHWFRV